MIINIFSEYIVPLLKDINHPVFLQERELDIDAAGVSIVKKKYVYI